MAEAFTEFPGRFLVATTDPAGLVAAAEAAGIPAVTLGMVGGDRLTIDDLIDLPVEVLTARSTSALRDALDAAGRVAAS